MQDAWTRYRSSLQSALQHSLEANPFSHGDLLREQTEAAPPADYELAALVCLRVCESLGGDEDAALPAAASLALIAQMGLVFGGLESQGGSASLSTAWGMPRALNAGDGFFVAAQGAILAAEDLGPDRGLAAVALLDTATHAYVEAVHAASAGDDALELGQRALLPAAASLGWLYAGAEEGVRENLTRLAEGWASLSPSELATRLEGDLAGMLDGSNPVGHSS